MKEAVEMGGSQPPPHLYRFFHIFSRTYPYISFCVVCVCCALLCGVRVLSSFVSCKRQTGHRTCKQDPSQEIRQANIRLHKSDMLSIDQNAFPK